MKVFFWVHVSLGLLMATMAGCASGRAALLAYVSGSALAALNVLTINFSWKRILKKKSIALSVAVIVFKYAAIFGVLSYLYSLGWRLDFGFLIGLVALFPAIGFLAYRQNEVEAVK